MYTLWWYMYHGYMRTMTFLGDNGSELADFRSLKFVSLSSLLIVRAWTKEQKQKSNKQTNKQTNKIKTGLSLKSGRIV